MALPNDTFCILPWTHFYHDPLGRLQPCCSTDYKITDYGNIKDYDSAQQLMNTDQMKQLRKDMLAGVKNPSCSTCHKEDQNGLVSFRQIKNNMIQELDIDVEQLIKNTDADGYLNDFAIQYWDVRFSNVCNLKCRMCGVKYSHSWGQDAVELKQFAPRKNFVFHSHDGLEYKDYISKYGDLSQLKEVYFAGGESLFQKDHWDMLDHLISIDKTDVRLVYNTNLTKLSFGSRKLTDYIEKFKGVNFIVSVDATRKLFEYIRTGADWKILNDNLEVIKRYPNVNIKFNCAVSIFNILYLADVISFVHEHNIRNNTSEWLLDLSPVHFPEELSVVILPEQLKDLAEQRLTALPQYNQHKNSIDGIISFMRSYTATTEEWIWATQYAKQIDEVRAENILEVVPELKDYWTYTDMTKIRPA